MPLGISSYVDPGVYVRERLLPGSITVSSGRVLCIVGTAPRTRRTSDEAIVRGKVYDETLSVAAATPYIATLSSPCDRDRNNAILYKNDQALRLGDWSFNAASLTGGAVALAKFDTSIIHLLTVSLDGKAPTTLELSTQGADTTITTIASELNTALALVSAYGSAYSAVFSTTTTTIANDTLVITSPITTSASDVKVFLSFETAGFDTDMASTVSGAVWAPAIGAGVQADTVLTIIDSLYTSTATYTIEYVSIETTTDPLTNATATNPLDDIVAVGSFPGGTGYVEGTDYEETGNTVDWLISGTTAQAAITSLASTAWAALTTATDEIKLSINGEGPWTVVLTTNVPGAPSAADVAGDINSWMNTNVGPQYAHIASVSGLTVVLTAPSPFENYPTASGAASVIELYDSTGNGVTNIFGIAAASLPYEVNGTGSRPAFGSIYYTSYDYTRPSTDYDLPVRVYDADQLYEYTSPLTLANYDVNQLAIAGEIAFENGVSTLYLVQIDDTTAPGTPTLSQISAAIDVAEESSVITDVVVLDTTETTAVNLMNHVSNMSSLINKKYRRGWYGMARSTAVGDPDTPDTFVYRATQTLQPGNTSSGRGRQILCAPSECSRTLTLEDSREVTVELDGSYLAVANAALFVSLPNPSDAMLGRTITGFLTDTTFETYLQAERYVLAGNGVNVVTLSAGNLKLLDPLTTEAGGGKVIQFEEPSSSAQKDSVTRAIEDSLDANVKGMVPESLSDFITDIKIWISLAISAQINAGVIAPFRNSDGTTREISMITDIKVAQDSADPRSFVFKYWFNLKYVAKRFFGEYSVDNPFFSV